MALLSVKERKALFKELGLEYNKSTIKALQQKYMYRRSDWDGIYGPNTENMLLTIINTKRYAGKNFKPEEFRCSCKGKYCCGFPSHMKPHELILIQNIRTHYGRPITVTSALRCKRENGSSRGSIQQSKHLTGQAIDFYQPGVTNTLANRKAALKWIKRQKYFSYGYGNGINSNGYRVRASYMGSALHVDSK